MRKISEKEIEKLPILEEWKFVNPKYQIRKVSKDMPMLFVLQIHITDFCNLHCLHCYDESSVPEHMTYDLFCKIINDFTKFIEKHRYLGEILITGGEPLLHPRFYEILNYLYERFCEGYPFKVVIETNGTLINKSNLEKLNTYRNMIYEFQISIDGMEEVHDANRGKGSWQLSKEAINQIHLADYQVAISAVLTKKNYSDIKSVLIWAKDMCVRRVTISRLIPLGKNAQQARKNVLEKDVFKKVWEELYNIAGEMVEDIIEGKGTTFLCMQRCDLWHLTDIERSSYQWRIAGSPRYLLAGTACQIGNNILAILPDGSVLPCRRYPERIGNMKQNSLGEIWVNNDLLKTFRLRVGKLRGKCKTCKFFTDPIDKKLCSGGAPCLSKALGNTIYDPDPLCYINEVTNVK